MNSSAKNSSKVAKILALTVCLFGLTAQLSAQRTDEESLAGLRDMGLVVKYGEVNGQAAQWQATALQSLEARATKQLQEAGIRVLTADEATTGGRAKLVFTVNLNRVDNTASPVRIDTKLYQRVRLSRDSTMEMELPTWTMAGHGGPMVNLQMLSDVFDAQVEAFFKYYKPMNPTTSEAPTEKIPAAASQLSDTRYGFEGLNSTKLFVNIREDRFSDARQKVLQQFLQDAAETRLKEAGIKLIRYANESEQAGHAELYISIILSQPNVHVWAPPIGVESRFSQWVRLVRDPKKQTDAVTWQSRIQGEFVKNTGGELVITDDAVLELVNKQVDEFIKAFKAANTNATSVAPQPKSDSPRQ
jgi:hypothetical protein